MFFYVAIVFALSATCSFAQKGDTIQIDGSNINTAVLKPGTHRYLVYFKNGKDSARINYQFWSRTIEFTDYKGVRAIHVTQEWEDNKGVVHKVSSFCDRKTFAPLFHDTWWAKRGSGKFDFVDKKAYVNDVLLTDADTAKTKVRQYKAFKKSLDQYQLNWHLDLETFPILPYKEGVTFIINFYDPGFGEPKKVAYSVVGSGVLTGYDNQKIDCWILSHESNDFGPNKELFWISKKTKEVLKLEQEFSGRYRYKIKLGFSL